MRETQQDRYRKRKKRRKKERKKEKMKNSNFEPRMNFGVMEI